MTDFEFFKQAMMEQDPGLNTMKPPGLTDGMFKNLQSALDTMRMVAANNAMCIVAKILNEEAHDNAARKVRLQTFMNEVFLEATRRQKEAQERLEKHHNRN